MALGPALRELDSWTNAEIAEHGRGAHEIRTWVAAYAALAEGGPYEVSYRYYRPIPQYIAGFAVTTAQPSGSRAELPAAPPAAEGRARH